MRPKHFLWILVAILWSAWYVLDPEARLAGSQVQAADRASDRTLLSARPVASAHRRETVPEGL
jgi:hypothetical protein